MSFSVAVVSVKVVELRSFMLGLILPPCGQTNEYPLPTLCNVSAECLKNITLLFQKLILAMPRQDTARPLSLSTHRSGVAAVTPSTNQEARHLGHVGERSPSLPFAVQDGPPVV